MTTPTIDPDEVAPAVAELDTIVSLSKRRGFIFPSSEIYGGINAVWDYGPLGVELKNNVKRAWWRSMVQERDDIVGLDAGILMHPEVWVTSGHVGSFSDPLVECATDHRRFRLDELPGAENLSATDLRDPTIVERLGLKCPVDGGPLSAPRRFNLMFKTFMGPVEEDASVVYLRPETAQGSYVNFKNVQQSSRKKLPFGIAQIGKSFRNEISPGNFVFRMREFEQMEMQYFVRPEADAAAAFEEWLPKRRAWYERYGVTPERLRLREHAPDELAHYAKKAVDVEYRFPFGWKELEGVHNRGDFDLSRHSEASGETLEYFDQATNEHVIPWVVETAAGADRAAFTFLIDAYREEEVRGETRVSLALHPDLAPYKVAVLPLLKKRPEIVELCHRIKDDLKRHTMAVYDDTAAIGKLYRRQDEIGTPWCITVDVDSLEDGAVTVRDRDLMEQQRVPIEGVTRLILDRLEAARGGERVTFGAPDARPLPIGHVAVYLVGVAGLAFCMTLLWLGMRAVMDLGGFCASGGPYEIAVECPDAVVATTPLSILGGFLSVGLMLWGGAALGGSWMSLVFLAWPALFLTLGWNFLAYGFFPPEGGWIWSWIFCGVLFVLMGGVPLIGAIGVVRDEVDGSRVFASGRVVVRPRPIADTRVEQAPGPTPDQAPDEPLVDRLERLATMRRRGDLTTAEYEAAKAATLAEAEATS